MYCSGFYCLYGHFNVDDYTCPKTLLLLHASLEGFCVFMNFVGYILHTLIEVLITNSLDYYCLKPH